MTSTAGVAVEKPKPVVITAGVAISLPDCHIEEDFEVVKICRM
jgi:hypothetical protein